MANKYIIQRRTASGLETVAELPALESGKIDLSWLPVVGSMGSAIIERGSNANGDYIRWADGTQVCWGYYSQPVAASGATTLTFPAQFSDANPSMAAGIEPNIVTGALPGATPICNVAPRSTSTFALKTIYITIDGKITAPPVAFLSRWIAIGRWK